MVVIFVGSKMTLGASQVVLVVKNPLANVGDIRDQVPIPGWGRSLVQLIIYLNNIVIDYP